MGFTIVKSDSGIATAFVKGQTLSVSTDHPAYNRILTELSRGNGDEAIRLSQMSRYIANYIRDPNNLEALRVEDGIVYFRNEAVKDSLTDRIVEFLRAGQDINPWVLFFENLWQNPSYHSRNQLYNFMQHFHLPLTADGCLIAYKRVQDNFTDFWTGTFDNSVGKHVSMDRNRVDDDWSNDCSYGLHVGSIDFVRGFNAGKGHVLLVKVNPRDAVSVPQYTTTKMRVCDYDVLEKCNPELIGLSELVYTADGVNPVTPIVSAERFVKDWIPVNPIEEEDDDDGDGDEESAVAFSEKLIKDKQHPIPIVLLLWCETVGILKDEFAEIFNEPANYALRNAWGNRDGYTFVEKLQAATTNNVFIKNVLGFGDNLADLRKIVSNT